jgi:hypothetical protein
MNGNIGSEEKIPLQQPKFSFFATSQPIGCGGVQKKIGKPFFEHHIQVRQRIFQFSSEELRILWEIQFNCLEPHP